MTEEIDVADLVELLVEEKPKVVTKKRARSAKKPLPAHRADRWICGYSGHLCEYGIEDDGQMFATLRCALADRIAKKKDPAKLLARYHQTADNVVPSLPLAKLSEFGGDLSYAEWLEGTFWLEHAAKEGVTVAQYKTKRDPKKAKPAAEKKRSYERGVYVLSSNKAVAKVVDLCVAYAKLNSFCGKQDKLAEFHVVHESTPFGFILRCAPGTYSPQDVALPINKLASALVPGSTVFGPAIATFLRATSVKEQD